MINVLQFIGLFLLLLAMFLCGRHVGRAEAIQALNLERLAEILEDIFDDVEDE